MIIRTLALLGALAIAAPLHAQPSAQPVTWDLINEYPATAIPGEADTFFAEAVKRLTEGRVIINPIPDAKSGLRTREQLKAVSDGRHAMANMLAGALADESPVFLLSSLPFVTASAGEARALENAAMPLYDKLFAERKQKVLFVTPWPPSGIWSAKPVNSLEALRALKIRTYDKAGTDLFAQVSAAASVVSFSDLPGRLDAGEINAVLSSGDGGDHLRGAAQLRHGVARGLQQARRARPRCGRTGRARDDRTAMDCGGRARRTQLCGHAREQGRDRRKAAGGRDGCAARGGGEVGGGMARQGRAGGGGAARCAG
jgi:TRAP-type mannitol/chloroaromatic compound transport system substrate-binding protein